MRIRVLSDLHLEFDRPHSIPGADADLVILAGDIHNGTAGILWAADTFSTPVVYVPGNHEYYGGSIPAVKREMQAAAAATRGRVCLLDPGEFALPEFATRVLGVTLWADFTLFGGAAHEIEIAMQACQRYMTDFNGLIRIPAGEGLRAFLPRDCVGLHRAELDWLERKLERPYAGKTVVVTHHAPHRGSLAERFARDLVSAGFITDLGRLMGKRVALWVHGHTHDAFDYSVDGTRVVCHPRGYVDSARGVAENPSFDWRYSLEL